MTEQRRLAAILVADVVGYSKLIGSDEVGTLAQLGALRADIIEPQIAKHAGRLFKSVGDGFFIEFASAVQAVSCAKAIQEANDLGRLPLRIGIHVGDVVVQGDDLMGDGVNVAARVEGIADLNCAAGRAYYFNVIIDREGGKPRVTPLDPEEGRALVAVMPLETLQARFGSLSDEYEMVTGDKPFAHGAFPNPPEKEEEWRAGVLSLIEELAKFRRAKLIVWCDRRHPRPQPRIRSEREQIEVVDRCGAGESRSGALKSGASSAGSRGTGTPNFARTAFAASEVPRTPLPLDPHAWRTPWSSIARLCALPTEKVAMRARPETGTASQPGRLAAS
jgi:hypothetical protein